MDYSSPLRNVSAASAKKVPPTHVVQRHMSRQCSGCCTLLTSGQGDLCDNCARMKRFGIGHAPMPGGMGDYGKRGY